MVNHNNELDHMVRAAREDVPDDAAWLRARAHLRQTISQSPPKETMMSMLFHSLGTKIAWATLLVFSTLGAGFFFGVNPPGSQPLLLASVIEEINLLEGYRAHMTLGVMGTTSFEMDLACREPDRTRLDMGSGISMIIDRGVGEMLTLDHNRKIGFYTEVDAETPAESLHRQDWLDRVRSYQGRADEILEVTEINGRSATGFVLRVEGYMLTLWADNETELPLRLILGPGESGVDLDMTMDFTYGELPDPSLFELSLPVGYSEVEED